ncbi:hypothetical protein ABBQ38_002806 [Trebouxia sp. C0009 RCD-2024]
MAPGVLTKMLPPTLRPSTTDLRAAVAWAATGGAGVIFLVQPFDWIKAQLGGPVSESGAGESTA